MLYVFFWVILIIIISLLTYLPRKMEQTECSETSAYKIQTPGNYPEENIQQVGINKGIRGGKVGVFQFFLISC
jgi:hypothetical protein